MFAIEDVAFNAILIRNNQQLKTIAKSLNTDLPKDLLLSMKRTEQSFNDLWDPFLGQYFSRDFITHRLLTEPSIATMLALYAGSIPVDHAKSLVHQLKDKHSFKLNYPVPSTPLNSRWYKANNYWQGPTWVNINWLIIDGLIRYDFLDEARELRQSTLQMVSNYGCYEYFNPEDGSGLGTPDFSWTAALTADLILNPIK